MMDIKLTLFAMNPRTRIIGLLSLLFTFGIPEYGFAQKKDNPFTKKDTSKAISSLAMKFSEGGGGFSGYEKICTPYDNLSIVDYLEDEVALWKHYLDQSHIAQLYSYDPRKVLVDDSMDYPFTRFILKVPYMDYGAVDDPIPFCGQYNGKYYRPFYRQNDEFTNLCEFPEAELEAFKAISQYVYLKTLKEKASERAIPTSIIEEDQRRQSKAQESFLNQAFAIPTHYLKSAYQKGMLELKKEHFQETANRQELSSFLRKEDSLMNEKINPSFDELEFFLTDLQYGWGKDWGGDELFRYQRHRGYRHILENKYPGREALHSFRQKRYESALLRSEMISSLLHIGEKLFSYHEFFYKFGGARVFDEDDSFDESGFFEMLYDTIPKINNTASTFYWDFTYLYESEIRDAKDSILMAVLHRACEILKAVDQQDPCSIDGLGILFRENALEKAIHNEHLVQIESSVNLGNVIENQIQLILKKVDEIETKRVNLKEKFESIPREIWQPGEIALINGVLNEAKDMIQFTRDYFRLVNLLPGDSVGEMDIFLTGLLLDKWPYFQTGVNGPVFDEEDSQNEFYLRFVEFHSSYEKEEIEAYSRVKALESAFSTMRDLYREKLDPVIHQP